MPINIPDNLPAYETLTNENIFVMTEERAIHQDIRPLRIAIFNIMPTKIVTETQLLRLIGNSPLQVDIVLLHPRTYTSKHTPEEHLRNFYKTFDDVKDEAFDGMIITGLQWSAWTLRMWTIGMNSRGNELERNRVYCTMYICWAALAGLYHFYNIPKYPLDEKIFGVFEHRVNVKNVKLLRGFDDVFYAPHSRHSEVRREDVNRVPDLEILSESDEAGTYIIRSRDDRQIFVTGHSEYDPLTLKSEYDRDIAKGMKIHVPKNYYPDDDPTKEPVVRWRGHANLLFCNWLNYYVYQETPYNLGELK